MYWPFKRVADGVLASIVLLLLFPLMLSIALLIRLDSEGPAYFRQWRSGRDRRPFEIIKFRTMRVDAPGATPTHLLRDSEQYVTRVGRFLRKTSLDELPQLINVLKGDMSLVGPRPALCTQMDLLLERDKYGANGLRPGITGWAQVNGRDELAIPAKAALDGHYAVHAGWWMDLRCIVATVMVVVRQEGVRDGCIELTVPDGDNGQGHDG